MFSSMFDELKELKYFKEMKCLKGFSEVDILQRNKRFALSQRFKIR